MMKSSFFFFFLLGLLVLAQSVHVNKKREHAGAPLTPLTPAGETVESSSAPPPPPGPSDSSFNPSDDSSHPHPPPSSDESSHHHHHSSSHHPHHPSSSEAVLLKGDEPEDNDNSRDHHKKEKEHRAMFSIDHCFDLEEDKVEECIGEVINFHGHVLHGLTHAVGFLAITVIVMAFLVVCQNRRLAKKVNANQYYQRLPVALA
eukprot:TRINITY_DN587_c0_g1_i1.p1 TRINITY_DN587_c0_g1~~TRINITY_DN587_c0_g1_i1.p1  ORF type:complete len:202 (-),score=71.06 TRINITY_DN587_c0_g1_i1:87-692(-)